MKRIAGRADVSQVPSYACEKAPPEGPQKAGYGPGDGTGLQRTEGAAAGSPKDLPVDDLVHILKDLGLGLLTRDLVCNPDPPLPKDVKRKPGD